MSKLNEGEQESLLQQLPEGQRLVTEECIKMDTYISSKGHRYSDKFLTMCLLLHSPAAYDFPRRNDLMPLPAVSTVRKYISLVRPECGFDSKFFESFKKRLLNKKDIQRHGMLVFHEIQVRQGREVNARTFSYIGQVQHPDTSEPPLADHALVFMFVPFAGSYTQPVVLRPKGQPRAVPCFNFGLCPKKSGRRCLLQDADFLSWIDDELMASRMQTFSVQTKTPPWEDTQLRGPKPIPRMTSREQHLEKRTATIWEADEMLVAPACNGCVGSGRGLFN
ncbi:hypothetical protein HPB49_022511 [Dermacentor silvarum]|uniref:Uncharacterized protein n=1 Tax=Dermacentor silvarum TaxID=543639 RepID=A0ACB8C5Q6_DERSI|nr:hypothetical protein HPB49_022511 [Dermacentor silvarum]